MKNPVQELFDKYTDGLITKEELAYKILDQSKPTIAYLHYATPTTFQGVEYQEETAHLIFTEGYKPKAVFFGDVEDLKNFLTAFAAAVFSKEKYKAIIELLKSDFDVEIQF